MSEDAVETNYTIPSKPTPNIIIIPALAVAGKYNIRRKQCAVLILMRIFFKIQNPSIV
jgi:hypothetical protein